MSFLTSPAVSMAAGGLAFLGTMTLLLLSAGPASKAPDEHVAAEEPVVQAYANPEIDQLMAELRERIEAVNKRESQLKELEARLLAERAEIAAVTQAVHELQREFDQNVTRVREEETPNLKKLARMYAGMEPAAAMPILKQLDDAGLVRLLLFMKEAEVANILEQLARPAEADAKRAAAIAERLRVAVVEGKKK